MGGTGQCMHSLSQHPSGQRKRKTLQGPEPIIRGRAVETGRAQRPCCAGKDLIRPQLIPDGPPRSYAGRLPHTGGKAYLSGLARQGSTLNNENLQGAGFTVRTNEDAG